MLLGQGYCFASISRVSDYVEARMTFQQEPEPFADYRVVVGEQNADSLHAGIFPASGRVTRSSVPCPGSDSTARLPPR